MATPKQSLQCSFSKGIFKIRVAEPSEDIKRIFELYSENGTMTIHKLQQFMTEYQKDSNAREDAEKIFNSLKHLNIFHRRGLNLDTFFQYLLGDLNTPLSAKVHHDMRAPLSDYFIYTSHNSYLTGNQLTRDSSVDPIINALKKGVRVIELDLWPDPEENGVKVCHAGTLTSPVDLIKCLTAIKDNAFLASEYPVFITFESHLTPELQAKVAEMVTETFEGNIFAPKTSDKFPTSDSSKEKVTTPMDKFPTPDSLKKKVMISTKPPREYLESLTIREKENLPKLKTWSSMKEKVKKPYSKKLSDNYKQDHVLIEEGYEEKAASEYKKLIPFDAIKVKGRSESWSELVKSKAKRLSISEQQLEYATGKCGQDIIRFTQQNIMRVYPKGTRIDSSNYNPFVGWAHGAQMVAFDMQETGKYLSIMQGMFRANGGCGYVKKPDFLLMKDGASEVFNPTRPLPVQHNLKVKIYHGEGWHLDFGHTVFDRHISPDFFIKIGINGLPADERKEQTEPVMNEWVPEWNKEFEFPLRVPELAVLRVQVFDNHNTRKPEFAGQTCLPVSDLKSGIRAVRLHDKNGEPYKHTRLLMQFQF